VKDVILTTGAEDHCGRSGWRNYIRPIRDGSVIRLEQAGGREW